VVDDGKLVGIVTDKDLMRVTPSAATTLAKYEINSLLADIAVREIMSKSVISVNESAPIEEAALLMSRNRVSGLPVTSDVGTVVGVITETDIFDAFVDIMDLEEGKTRVTIEVQDKVGVVCDLAGIVSEAGYNIDSFVIMRADKTPTYNFACACDDMMQGVSFVIRGEDHVSNTPKQNWIRQSLGYDGEIKYAHLPIILNSEGKKMSKREDSSSVKWLLQSGYLPEAIANYLILLGNKTPREVFSMNEAVEFFDIAKISKSPAKFDEDKLAFINREHIKRASEQRLAELFELEPKFAPLIKFYTQEASLIPRIKEKIAAIYGAKDIPQEWAAQAQALREAILNLLSSNGAPMEFNDFKAALSQATSLKGKSLFMPLRFLLTGAPHGPELSELYPLIRADLKEILDATK